MAKELKDMTREEYNEYMVIDTLKGFITEFEQKKEYFVEKLSSDASRAISYYAEDVVRSEIKARKARIFFKEVEENGKDVYETLQSLLRSVGEELDMAHFSSPSSNLYSNANEHYERYGLREFIRNVERYAKRIGAIKDRQDNVTDMTRQVLVEQKKALVKDWGGYDQGSRLAKTKKEREAMALAAHATMDAIKRITKQAEELNIDLEERNEGLENG